MSNKKCWKSLIKTQCSLKDCIERNRMYYPFSIIYNTRNLQIARQDTHYANYAKHLNGILNATAISSLIKSSWLTSLSTYPSAAKLFMSTIFCISSKMHALISNFICFDSRLLSEERRLSMCEHTKLLPAVIWNNLILWWEQDLQKMKWKSPGSVTITSRGAANQRHQINKQMHEMSIDQLSPP